MPSGINFLEDFGGFYFPKWNQDASKNLLKSMSISKGYFFKKPCFSLGKTMILKVRGVQVGSKNRLKIDQKMKSTWEGILASIFHRFWWILGAKLGGKIEPRSIKNGIEKRLGCLGGILRRLGPQVGLQGEGGLGRIVPDRPGYGGCGFGGVPISI